MELEVKAYGKVAEIGNEVLRNQAAEFVANNQDLQELSKQVEYVLRCMDAIAVVNNIREEAPSLETEIDNSLTKPQNQPAQLTEVS